MRASWLVLLVAGAACRSHGEAADEEEARAPAQVTCKPVASGTIDEVVEINGVIAPPPRLDAVISSPVAGRVGRVEVEEGDHVVAGALLASIEDPSLPAGTIETKAIVASATAAKAAADQDLARQQRLVDSGIGARRDLDEARAKAAAAAAELDAANARAGLAVKQLARKELRAPHAGVVLHVWKRVGESVDGTTSTPVAEVADVSTLELRAQLPPAQLVTIREGMRATVHLTGDDRALPASVARVAPAVDATTLLGAVRVQLEGAQVVTVGASATGQIVTGSHPGLRVPASALRRSIVGADEVVVCEGAVARVKSVTVGRRGPELVEISAGIAPTEAIVVDHVLGLEDGQPLALEAKGK